MEVITLFLEKYKHITIPSRVIEKVVFSVIREVLKTEVHREDISVVRHTVCVSAHPVVKYEIRKHEQELLARINQQLTETSKIQKIY